MKKIVYTVLLAAGLSLGSCNYLDVLPDNITTLDMAFNNRANAIKYLATCYNFVPSTWDVNGNAAISCADDYCPYLRTYDWDFSSSWDWARGLQNSSNPYFNYWSGGAFRGVHECNVFLANIDRVPDMSYSEMNRWKAEVYTLKGLYLYWLFLHYGPIPLLDENVPIDAELQDMFQYREKVDDVVAYIVKQLDTAINMDQGLPQYISAVTTEMGRITLPAALGIKAKVLTTAASPLFNGNTDYADFLDPRDNQPFFNQTYSREKWEIAAAACKEAIDAAIEGKHDLFKFEERVAFTLTPETELEMTLREIVASRYNCEQVFAPGVAPNYIQQHSQPRLTAYDQGHREYHHYQQFSPTLNIVEEYYTKNGLPIEEDKSFEGVNLYELVQTPSDRPAFFVPDYTTVRLHLDREPRFYANLGFDGGKWFNSEVLSPEEAYGVNPKNGGIAGHDQYRTSATGYFVKKLSSYRNMNTEASEVIYTFPNTLIRLADLYLLYSEALNESLDQPNEEVYKYIQMVRHRAGLDQNSTLQETWANYSNNPTKPLSKEGMREIIHRERLIELQFEGKRFHDLRRWKKCIKYFNTQMRGFTYIGKTPEDFYVSRVIYSRSFSVRDYLWPLAQGDLNRNTRLVQNPLW